MCEVSVVAGAMRLSEAAGSVAARTRAHTRACVPGGDGHVLTRLQPPPALGIPS